MTPAAQMWQDRLDEIAPGRFRVMMRVMAVGARSAASGSFRARVRSARGEWAILRASPLIGRADEQVAVTIEPATGDQLLGLLLVAYGLTAREPDICREVIAGALHRRDRRAPVHLREHRAGPSEVGSPR